MARAECATACRAGRDRRLPPGAGLRLSQRARPLDDAARALARARRTPARFRQRALDRGDLQLPRAWLRERCSRRRRADAREALLQRSRVLLAGRRRTATRECWRSSSAAPSSRATRASTTEPARRLELDVEHDRTASMERRCCQPRKPEASSRGWRRRRGGVGRKVAGSFSAGSAALPSGAKVGAASSTQSGRQLGQIADILIGEPGALVGSGRGRRGHPSVERDHRASVGHPQLRRLRRSFAAA
jgi:hypothetical protein